MGLLGRGIAACLLSRGLRVIAYTRSDETRRAARQYISEAIDQLIERGGFSPALRADWPQNYREARSISGFGESDFVIESVVEDLAAKQSMFDEIEAAVGPRTPIASKTSAWESSATCVPKTELGWKCHNHKQWQQKYPPGSS